MAEEVDNTPGSPPDNDDGPAGEPAAGEAVASTPNTRADLTTGPLFPHIWRLAIPSMATTALHASYHAVDTWFIAHIPLIGTTFFERFAVLVASFAFGLCRFILLLFLFFMPLLYIHPGYFFRGLFFLKLYIEAATPFIVN